MTVDEFVAITGRLMEQFDRWFPDATPFTRGSYEYEVRKVLADIRFLGGDVVFAKEDE